MYHYHILSLDREETVRKLYEKQKRQPLKGDWIQLLKSDFEFMGIQLDEQAIIITPKQVYRKKIKYLIRKAALNELTELKNTLSKIRDLKYETLIIQPFFKCPKFHSHERKLLYSLRSRMHPSKNIFRKMHPNSLKCSLGCIADEDQRHIFENCSALKSYHYKYLYDFIFKDSDKQKEAISVFISIEQKRQELIQCAENNL